MKSIDLPIRGKTDIISKPNTFSLAKGRDEKANNLAPQKRDHLITYTPTIMLIRKRTRKGKVLSGIMEKAEQQNTLGLVPS